MDRFTRKKRSLIMSHVKSRDTKPEILVRRLLHKMGYRFRIYVRTLPGNPDIVLPRHKKIFFVHGCFWHGHKGCKRAQRPASNAAFWNRKIEANIERDTRVRRKLKSLGWRIFVVWQCQTHKQEAIEARIRRFMKN